MPLIRRLPKRGFNNAAFHIHYAIVNLDDLNAFKAGAVVNEQLLRESKLVRGHFAGIKVLGNGELKHGLTIEADKVSAGAREKIEKAGGTVTLRDRSAERKIVDVAPEAVRTKAAAETPKKSTKKPAAKAKSPKKKAARKA
jgi:large subunit ribosomal protein L15